MNTDRLVAAYDDLLTAAALLDLASLAAPQRDEAEWLIAHLILSDPILIAAAGHLLEGADTVVVDKRHAMDDDAITTVLASLSHDDRIQAIKGPPGIDVGRFRDLSPGGVRAGGHARSVRASA